MADMVNDEVKSEIGSLLFDYYAARSNIAKHHIELHRLASRLDHASKIVEQGIAKKEAEDLRASLEQFLRSEDECLQSLINPQSAEPSYTLTGQHLRMLYSDLSSDLAAMREVGQKIKNEGFDHLLVEESN